MSERRPKVRDSVTVVDVDGEGVLMDPETGATQALNATATIVWYSLDGRRTVEELAAELGAAFGTEKEQVRADIQAFVDELDGNGLLE